MGLFDTLLGRTKPVRANLDALFALPSAAVTLETAEGVVTTGRAGVCWKPPAGRSPADVQDEINQLLQIDDGDPAMGGGTSDGAAAGQGSEEAAEEAGAAGTAVVPDEPAPGPVTQAEDSFGYRWLLLEEPELDDLVTRVHVINSTLSDNGWGPQLLCSVFGMKPAPQGGEEAKPFFLVYLFKRGTFYPFAPDGKEHRDAEYELHLRSVVGSDLPVEADLSRWFPLWDLPVH
jgi:hypothetical protein